MKSKFLLKNYRLSKNYTQQYVADQLCISRQQYCNIENGKTGKISAEHRIKLCTLLDIPEVLIDNTGIASDDHKAHHTNGGHFPDQKDQLIELLTEQNRKLVVLLEQLAGKAV